MKVEVKAKEEETNMNYDLVVGVQGEGRGEKKEMVEVVGANQTKILGG